MKNVKYGWPEFFATIFGICLVGGFLFGLANLHWVCALMGFGFIGLLVLCIYIVATDEK